MKLEEAPKIAFLYLCLFNADENIKNPKLRNLLHEMVNMELGPYGEDDRVDYDNDGQPLIAWPQGFSWDEFICRESKYEEPAYIWCKDEIDEVINNVRTISQEKLHEIVESIK